MKDHLVSILIKHRPELVDEIDPTELLNHLLARGVLTKRQAKSISCQPDPYKQNEALLDALHRRPDGDYEEFCQSLISTNQEKVVNTYLRPKGDLPNESNVLTALGIELRIQDSSISSAVRIRDTSISRNDKISEWDVSSGPIDIQNISVAKSSTEFYLKNKKNSYSLNKSCRGQCLIISNEIFSGEKPLSNREGSSVDVGNLDKLFTQLHFKTTVIENQTADQMTDILDQLAKDDSLSDDQCFVLFIMSHGKQLLAESASGERVGTEYLYGCDGELVSINRLLVPFTNENCRQLSGKPKLIFIQACRGDVLDRTETDCELNLVEQDAVKAAAQLPSQCAASRTPVEKTHALNLKDFLVGFPTQSGYRSFRNVQAGSWYINALVQVLCRRACDSDIATILRMVNASVTKWVAKNPILAASNGGQCAEIKDCLTKENFFFFPGIVETEQ